MKAIEILGLMALVTLIYNVSLFFIKYKRKAYMNKEQVTIEASIETYDETEKLKARNEFLESELSSFVDISDKLQKQLNKTLDEFEAYVRLTQGEQEKPVKRSVTSLKDKECIRIGEGDWEKLAPLFEEHNIKWNSGSKASKFIPQIGWCVSTKSRGEGKLTQFNESHWIDLGFTILPSSDFIEPEPIEAPKPVKHLSEVNAIDWSVPQAFPEGYEMKKGTKVIAIESVFNVPIRTIGVVMENNWLSYIDWEGGKYRSADNSARIINGGVPYRSEQLAPLNPTDHPNHPDYVKR